MKNTRTKKLPETIAIGQIIVGERCRKDMGNVLGLAESIGRLGLLHPLVLNTRCELIAGGRRLAAIRKLGWTEAPCRIVETLDDAIAAIQAERDENTCREPLEFDDLVEIGRKIESLEKPKAKGRKGARTDTPTGKFPVGEAGRVSDKVGDSLGVSGKTYEKAKQIAEAAEKHPETHGDLPALAKKKSISAAHNELKRRQEPAETHVPAKAAEPLALRPSDRTQAVADAWMELAAWQRKYEHLAELAGILEAIKSLLPQVKAAA